MTWTRADAEGVLTGEEARIERLTDEIERGAYALERLAVEEALERVRERCAEVATVIERAALREDPATLAEAQLLIGALRAEVEQLRGQIVALEEKAERDHLTGVYDRAGVMGVFAREWQRNQRAKTSLGLLFVDVDDFKAVNDQLGHLAGDEALKAIARTIADEARRSGEVVGRFGGDEFIVIVPGSDLAGTLAIGERIRAAVATLRVRGGDRVLTLSVSVGAAALTPTRALVPETLLDRADRAVYRAKAGGKGRAVALEVEEGRDVFFGTAPQPNVVPLRSR